MGAVSESWAEWRTQRDQINSAAVRVRALLDLPRKARGEPTLRRLIRRELNRVALQLARLFELEERCYLWPLASAGAELAEKVNELLNWHAVLLQELPRTADEIANGDIEHAREEALDALCRLMELEIHEGVVLRAALPEFSRKSA